MGGAGSADALPEVSTGASTASMRLLGSRGFLADWLFLGWCCSGAEPARLDPRKPAFMFLTALLVSCC